MGVWCVMCLFVTFSSLSTPFDKLLSLFSRESQIPLTFSSLFISKDTRRCGDYPYHITSNAYSRVHIVSLTRETRWLTSTQGVRPGTRPAQ